ncbi:MAG: AMP-binding protein [Bacteriovoracaceae bacterium]
MFDVNFDEEFKIITKSDLAPAGNRLRKELANLDFIAHYAIFSSGTSSRDLKGYVLSEKAMEANANAVNDWFGLTQYDVWGLSLPVYHVGGLSVLLRARILENRVVDLRKWGPQRWYKTLTDENVTITTIVPTQLYDLVKENLTAPSKLRYIIVGGDFLPAELERRAFDLGWPVIRTYGMTEVCSQLASGQRPGDPLRVLPIHEVKTNPEGLLQVKSPALFTAEFTLGQKLQLKFAEEGFYTTQDKVILEGDKIIPQGRMNQEIKVAGHLTNVLSLKDTLAAILLQEGKYGHAELLIETDERKGNRLVLLHQNLSGEIIEKVKNAMKPAVLDDFRIVNEFSRTDLGKMKLS